ncbi:13561_t:CDS:2, partial [Racocetra persica]
YGCNYFDQGTDELRLNEITKLSEKFGDFFPLVTEFGGIIQYQIDSVYEFLDDEVKMKFLKVFGQKILHFDTIDMTFDEENIKNREEREISVPTNILANMKENTEKYQIYATVLHTEEDI